MQEQTVIHSTFVIERSYPAKPERVFAAFSDPAKKRGWYAGAGGREVESLEMDFRVGGHERAQFRMGDDTPFPGAMLTNEATYQDIVPNRRIVMAYAMSLAGKRFSASLATIELLATEKGTDLIFTDQGAYFEGADGPERREQGWRGLLERVEQVLTGDGRA